MAVPLLAVALSELSSSASTSSAEDLREASNDHEEEREIQEGVDEDEVFRHNIARELKALRLPRGNSRELPIEAEGQRRSSLIRSRGAGDAENEGRGPQGRDPHQSRSSFLGRASNELAGSPSRATSAPQRPGSPHTPAAPPRGRWRAIGRYMFGSREGADVGPRQGSPDYVYPKYRWTPIFSGIVVPFSILLEIPSLTEPWYVRQVDGVAIVYQDNPVLLDVGLAISLACGVIANLALITRFLERRVFWSTILCIIMLSIHDIINIVALIIFGIIHGVDDGYDYSVAFWMCVCSTTASFFTNITLIYDIIRTKQFRHSGSGLTHKQRKLVIVVMVLFVYVTLGALCFNYLIPDITFQDSLYFTIATVETIGFGDISPSTGARIFLFFYMPIGILNLALAVGTARDMIVESWSAAYRRRRHKVVQRQRERKQQRAEESARLAAAERQLDDVASLPQVGGSDSSGASESRRKDRKPWGDRAMELKPLVHLKKAAKSAFTGAGKAENSETTRLQHREALAQLSSENEEGYKSFQERMKHEEKRELIWKFGSAGGLFIVFWLVGAGIFTRTEDSFSFFDAFYFCFVTFTTIGYGDVTVTSPAGRAVFVIWAICGVGIVTLLIAAVAEVYTNRYHAALQRRDKKLQTGRPVGAVGSSEKQPLTREEVDRLPHEILDVLKNWQAHLRLTRMIWTLNGGVQNTEAQILVDEFLAGRENGQDSERGTSPEGRSELFWSSCEQSTQRLIHLAEQSIGLTENAPSVILGSDRPNLSTRNVSRRTSF